jgi:hypothetical protein
MEISYYENLIIIVTKAFRSRSSQMYLLLIKLIIRLKLVVALTNILT